MENKHQHQWSDANPQSAICTMCGMRIGDYKDLTLRTESDLTALSYGRMNTEDYVLGTVRQMELYANQRVREVLDKIISKKPKEYRYSVIAFWEEDNDQLSDQEISRIISELIARGDYRVTKKEI